jgi:Tfp pilus assembly protein PilO
MQIGDIDIRRFGRLLHYGGMLATVLCATVGYSLVHAPELHAVAETSAKIDELTQSVQNAAVIREQHRKVSNKLHEVTTRIANVQRRVPRGADVSEFMNEVNQLANSQQLAIKDFHPEEPESKPGYAEMRVTLKGTGSYASICTFVDQLAKLTRLSKVKELTLSAGDNATEYPMTATLVIYFGLRGKDAKPAQEGRRG